jgi:predicted acyltransferase
VKITRRAILLVLLGMIYNGLLKDGFTSDLRCASVLGRIGLAYFFAALITLNTSTFRARALWTVALLVGYWAAMSWIPVPNVGAGHLEPGKTLADYVDRQLMPGRLFKKDRDPEGLLSTIPAVATCLLGVLAGSWLRRQEPNEYRKAAALLAAGAASLALGWLWSFDFPFNKNLWSSSFVLWAGGWSLLLLALFYLVIDVWQWKKWAFPFVVIGMNAITIYVARQFIDFGGVGKIVFRRAPVPSELLVPCAMLTLEWLLLYVLWRARVFLRL